MTSPYEIRNTSEIVTPALIIFRSIVIDNLNQMIEVAGDASRLRPHCKTHKMPAVTKLELERGITKHKAATMAEAEMLAEAGATDIFLAYNPVGANLGRVVAFLQKYPAVTFAVTADHPKPLAQLSEVVSSAGLSLDVLLDVDCGMHRTGIAIGEEAAKLYQQIADSPGLNVGGLHVYDGHQRAEDLDERIADVMPEWEKVLKFREQLEAQGLPVPKIVAGGTPTFPVYAKFETPDLELSPGTCVFHDRGYGAKFPDMKFTPAAVLLTRVISRPTPTRITVDLGNKGVASDPPAGGRLYFPALPDAAQPVHSEEHLVLETELASNYEPGDELIAIPAHICPTSALHKNVLVVEDGEVIDEWTVLARDRRITI